MKTRQSSFSNLAQRILHGRQLARLACTLAALFTLGACDQSIPIDVPPDDGSGGQTAPVEATGGVGGSTATVAPAAGAGGSASTSTSGSGGTTVATPSVGGAGGSARPVSSLPAGCAPISTTPSLVNPCGRATGVAYSADGRLLAIGYDGANPSVRVWRLSDGMPLSDLDGQSLETTYDVAFSPDGKILAAAGYQGGGDSAHDVPFVRLWDVATGALTRTLRPNTGWYADSVAFSADGTLLATGGYEGTVEVWRLADGVRALSVSVPTTAHNVHFSPDGSKLIVATVDMKARVYDVASGALVLGPLDIANEMADAEFSPDGKQIATTWQTTANAGGVQAVRIYDGQTGELLQSLAGHSAYVSHVVWVDQNRIVSGDWSGKVILWQRGDSGAFALAKTWSTGGQSLGLAVSPDKKTVVTGAGANGAAGFIFLAL
jgi:WD40 repeat protein